MNIAIGVCCLAISAVAAQMPSSAGGVRRTLLVHPDEFTDRWVDRAAALGIDTLAMHPEGGGHAIRSLEGLLKRLEDPVFRARIDRARAKGIEVSYEMHAASWLLPRALFGEHPEYFRQKADGPRTQAANLCVSSEAGLDIAAQRAVQLVSRLYGSSHRYFLWLDDVRDGACRCEMCRAYSASDQQLLFVNRILNELRKTIPDAQLCYLAYEGTLEPPKKVRPVAGVFLEYAPIDRDMRRPIEGQRAAVAPLGGLLDVFGRTDARVLDYWLDNSLFSNWQKPPKRFAAETAVVWQDIAFYRSLGFSDIASFACYLGDDYEQLWGEPNLDAFARGFHSSRGGFDRTDFTWRVAKGRFWFSFSTVDATVWAVEPFTTKRDIERGDRVELFFSSVEDLSKTYYCAEIDPKGRVLDYGCVFPRKFDYGWSFRTLERRAERTADGYRVEGSVALSELKALGIDPARCWIGAFRADFDEKGLVDWHSLTPHGPGEPDFHRPCQFFRLGPSR